MLTSFFQWLADSVLALGYPGIVLLMPRTRVTIRFLSDVV